MSTRTSRLPISVANIVVVVAMLAAAGLTAAFHNYLATVILAIIGAGGLVSALVARRPNASDLTRVNAIEYRDERDAGLARQGFAVVGVAALIPTLAEVIAATIVATIFFDRPLVAVIVTVAACGQLFVIYLVWAFANYAAVRRG